MSVNSMLVIQVNGVYAEPFQALLASPFDVVSVTFDFASQLAVLVRVSKLGGQEDI